MAKENLTNEQNKINEEDEKEEEENDYPTSISVPQLGKSISDFTIQVAYNIYNKNVIFFRPDVRQVVEIIGQRINDSSIKGFQEISPARFITFIEKFAKLGIWVKSKENGNVFFKEKSISQQTATIVLQSEIIENFLPKIKRIFQFPMPIIIDNQLIFPKKGYDSRLDSWLPYESPQINPAMPLEEAKKIIDYLFKEFCFEKRNDHEYSDDNGEYYRLNAIAGLLTPFIRGLYSRFTVRTPLFFYLGNRPRIGKDTTANISGAVFEGQLIQDPKIGSGTTHEELRKNIFSNILFGRKRMHFANCDGYIGHGIFEEYLTTEFINDRLLGGNKTALLPNEIDFSLSGNTGIRYSEDIQMRSKFVKLFLEGENVNSRKFENPYLEQWVLKKENREKVLSALFSLVKNWFNNNQPKGKEIFTSFPEWAEICGGIMECAGYKNPCHPDKDPTIQSGDNDTEEIRALIDYCYRRGLRNIPLQKKEIRKVIEYSLQNDEELISFAFFDFRNQTDIVRFHTKLNKFLGREFNGVYMIADNPKERSARQKIVFTKDPKGFKNGNPFDLNEPINEPFPSNSKPQIEYITPFLEKTKKDNPQTKFI